MPAPIKKADINLILKQVSEETFSGQFLAWALTYGRYIIIVIQIIVLSVFFMRFKLDRDHTDLKEAVSQKQALVQSVSDLETEIRRVQRKLASIRKISTNQDLPIQFLRFLQNTSPSNTMYSSIDYKPNLIKFIASEKNLREFNYLLRRLQQDNKFSEITLEDIVRRVDGRIEFKISAKIDPKFFK